MIVYNVTLKVDPHIATDWVLWQKTEHIPEVMAKGCFVEYKFFKLLEQDESEGITYVIQYFANEMSDYKNYVEKFAPELRNKLIKKWGEKIIAFRTIMQTV